MPSRTPPPSAISAPLRTLERALAVQSRDGESYLRGTLPSLPTRISAGGAALIISSDPGAGGARAYGAYARAQGARTVVRACAPTYDAALLHGAGVCVADLPFEDGCAPPAQVVDAWLALLDAELGLRAIRADRADAPGACAGRALAVHCAAGVGRAPVLVAIALIEMGLDPFDAVATLRARRRGAINARQTAFLQAYVPRRDRVVVKRGRSRSAGLLSALLPMARKAALRAGSGARSGGASPRRSPGGSLDSTPASSGGVQLVRQLSITAVREAGRY